MIIEFPSASASVCTKSRTQNFNTPPSNFRHIKKFQVDKYNTATTTWIFCDIIAMSNANDLLAMGFELANITYAIRATNGDMNGALELLLSGVVIESEGLVSVRNDLPIRGCQIIELTTSQYSYCSGSSACTSIALNALVSLLSQIESNVISTTIAEGADSEELQSIVTNGISTHQSAIQSLSSASQNHLSVDEVYITSSTLQTRLQMVSDVPIQGLLSRNYSQSFIAFINNAREIGNPSNYIGIVITKPPESVALIIPPVGQELSYYLFDSHSRPQINLFNAYLLVSADMASILDHLHTLFPVFESDGDEGMDAYSQIYNMYEGFVFQLNS